MKPLIIIPARGGSKGIPGKNIKLLGGRPLVAYTVDVAIELQKKFGGYVLLSTDSIEIADVVKSLGVDVEYMRPAELGGDTVGSREVMLDAMDWAEGRGVDYDCVVLLQPTSPFRKVSDVVAAMSLYGDDTDMVVSVCECPQNPYYNVFETDSRGLLHVCKGDGMYTRRQDVPKVWEYNGAVYVIRPESLREMPMGAFPVRRPSEMPRRRSLDLDTMADWTLAESLILQNEY